MPFTYDEIIDQRKKLLASVRGALETIESRLGSALDEEGLPVYLTKNRTKAVDSIYLKTKRKKYKSLDEITDYGGFKILCLFEQDIFVVHDYFLSILKDESYTLKELIVYNWGKEFGYTNKIKGLFKSVKANFPRSTDNTYKLKSVTSSSGYKSIHYVVNPPGDRMSIEIQLRTILQDAWGELDHTLSYKKGNIDPHIKSNFQLLAKDLANNDVLLSYLKDFGERKRAAEEHMVRHLGPWKYFSHKIPPLSKTSPKESKYAYEKYMLHVCSGLGHGKKHKYKDWVSKGNSLFSEIEKILVGKTGSAIELWVDAERAFWLFCKGGNENLDHAVSIYNRILKSINRKHYPHTYTLYFRLGEIYFNKGDTIRALINFDKSEALSKGVTDIGERLNLYRILVKTANLYWRLGFEFYNLSLAKILEAEKLVTRNKSLFEPDDLDSIKNNVCWYQLEIYILAQNKAEELVAIGANNQKDKNAIDKAKKLAAKEFAKTKTLLLKHERQVNTDLERATSNSIDTLSWGYFHWYKRTNNTKYLRSSKDYIDSRIEHDNYATYSMTSMNLHKTHIQEILWEANRVLTV